jgi:hypothetical protein
LLLLVQLLALFLYAAILREKKTITIKQFKCFTLNLLKEIMELTH